MATLGFIAGIIVSLVGLCITIYVGIKIANALKLTGLNRFICIVAVVWLTATVADNFLNPDFTGNPQKDGKILYERIYEDNEDFDTVVEELQKFYVEEGYGMFEAKEALRVCTDIRANN